MNNKKAGAIGGAGVAGLAAIVGGTYFFADRPDDPLTPEEPPVVMDDLRTETAIDHDDGVVRFCLPGVVQTDDGCAPLEDLKDERESLILPKSMAARPLRMASPDIENDAAETVESCAQFRSLRQKGWGGLSNADLRREAQMARACGLLELIARAEPVPGARGAPDDLFVAIDRSELPSLGEASLGDDAYPNLKGDWPKTWTMENDAILAEFVHVGTADFDGDPEAEHLIEWRLAAKGGTLRAIGFALAEDSPASFRMIDPLAE
ncbi:hypothetical protein [Parvularcula lutaonensis]|uniref:Uncharacterized protein n=1 Tax=Parvularcula lutaonensis TaxID=491923 RepID=A0ABV7MD64_9PROT|nr:hypothetical protein [Parvularcula lutaonensis]GGY52441.1 hypothetical protein GCM10007148_21930 [Parvularcula lutaonensis]